MANDDEFEIPPFHGENRGSIPLGRANEINELEILLAPAFYSHGKYTEKLPANADG
jgi:hypothetical protein